MHNKSDIGIFPPSLVTGNRQLVTIRIFIKLKPLSSYRRPSLLRSVLTAFMLLSFFSLSGISIPAHAQQKGSVQTEWVYSQNLAKKVTFKQKRADFKRQNAPEKDCQSLQFLVSNSLYNLSLLVSENRIRTFSPLSKILLSNKIPQPDNEEELFSAAG